MILMYYFQYLKNSIGLLYKENKQLYVSKLHSLPLNAVWEKKQRR